MKMTIIGVKRITGKAKATGNPFDMCHVIALIPVETRVGALSLDGAGMETMEIPLAVEALNEFKVLKFPAPVDLLVEPRPRNGKVESVIVGIIPARAA